jgi:hypothetical protein
MRTIHRDMVDDSTEKLWRARSLKDGEERKNVVVVVVVVVDVVGDVSAIRP